MLAGVRHGLATGWRNTPRNTAAREANGQPGSKQRKSRKPPSRARQLRADTCDAMTPDAMGFVWFLNLAAVAAGCVGSGFAASFLTSSQLTQALYNWAASILGSFLIVEPLWVVLVAFVVLRYELKRRKSRRVNLRAKLLMKVKLAATLRRFQIAAKHVTVGIENTQRGRSFDATLSASGEILHLKRKRKGLGGLAYEGGLRVGDRVVSIDGRTLEGSAKAKADLVRKMLKSPLGRTEFEVVRGEEGAAYDRARADAGLGLDSERQWAEPRKVTAPTVQGEFVGFDLGKLQFGGRAVIVVHVSQQSAFGSKLQPGDELLKINGMAFDSSELMEAHDCLVEADGLLDLEVRTPGYPLQAE